MMQKTVLILTFISFCLCGLVQANLIQNGSFELPGGYAPTAGGWQPQTELGQLDYTGAGWGEGGVPTPQVPCDHWTRTTRIWRLIEDGHGQVPDGSYAMRLDCGADYNGIDSLSQSGISLTAGKTYLLAFHFWGEANNAATQIDVKLTGAANVTLLDDYTTIGNDGIAEAVSKTFTAPASGTYTITFSVNPGLTGYATNHALIDHVSLVEATELYTVLTQPVYRAVFQRGLQNTALVPIAGTYAGTATRIEARAIVMNGFAGTPTDWQVISNAPAGGTFNAALPVKAGGWYRIEARVFNGQTAGPLVFVEKVGVGEVFITAGQSNSANYGSPALTPAHDTVSAWTGGNWRHAYDPQPIADGASGSAWSRLGDLLSDSLHVPIGFVTLGVGSTRVDQWLPGTDYYTRIRTAISGMGPNGVRSILWHQGESDSLAATTSATYASRLNSIIAQSRADAGWEIPWGVALASYHPSATSSNQQKVRLGQQSVIANTAGVFKGADTDGYLALGYLHDGVHFNANGLLDHAGQWQQAVVYNLFAGDFNLDGMTDLEDFSYFASKWLITNSHDGDMNNDNVVNLTDLMVLAENWLN